MFFNLLFYFVSFILIWFGAGLIINSTSKFTQQLKLSPFAFSFVFLGILTSTPEFSVGVQAVANHDAEIFVGNLLGGIAVLFLVVIPLLAILANGLSLKHELNHHTLFITLGVIFLPAILILDRRVTNPEGLLLISSYLVLLFLVERHHGIFDKRNQKLLNVRSYSYKDILKIILGLGIVFVASNLIVKQTMYFADLLDIPAFYISLIVVALGTDLPELTLAIKSVVTGKKEIAMGDYIGAAAASTLLFGIFTLLNNGEVITISNFFVTFIFIGTALILFFALSVRKNFISRRDGFFLICIYLLFVTFELMHK